MNLYKIREEKYIFREKLFREINDIYLDGVEFSVDEDYLNILNMCTYPDVYDIYDLVDINNEYLKYK